jgi:hypothetical protein
MWPALVVDAVSTWNDDRGIVKFIAVEAVLLWMFVLVAGLWKIVFR